MNYYQRLGVSLSASASDIKSAFRLKIKSIHPDLKGDKNHEAFEVHQLIEAYEVLSDPISRQAYDVSIRRYLQDDKSDFNYRDWLLSKDDEESYAKLIFYDSLRDRTSEALARFLSLQENESFNLERILGKEDFMDCGFMLATELDTMGNYLGALKIFQRLAQLEGQKPYFRHFFIEVEERTLQILLKRPIEKIPIIQIITIIEECQNYPFKNKSKVLLLNKQAELYFNIGQGMMAQHSLDRAKKLKKLSST